MRTQIEKSMEKLMEEIELLSREEMTDIVAEHLSVYRGAYKALCMVGNGGDGTAAEVMAASEAAQAARTIALDGDTEFERVLMEIPADTAHMEAVATIFADHMEGLKIINRKNYDNMMMRLREVAKK